jgi:hypothetical protein
MSAHCIDQPIHLVDSVVQMARNANQISIRKMYQRDFDSIFIPQFFLQVTPITLWQPYRCHPAIQCIGIGAWLVRHHSFRPQSLRKFITHILCQTMIANSQFVQIKFLEKLYGFRDCQIRTVIPRSYPNLMIRPCAQLARW